MIDLPTNLLVQNTHLLSGKTLLAEPPDAQSAQGISSCTESMPDFFTTNFGVYCTLLEKHFSVYFDASFDQLLLPKYDFIILYLQKSKRFNHYLIKNCLNYLSKKGHFILIGANKAGIKSWKKKLREYGEITYSTNGRHSALYQLAPNNQATPEHQSLKNDWLLSYSVKTENHHTLTLSTLPSVFSDGALDTGTQVLLSMLTTPVTGKILDFACGCGIIGCYLKHKNPDIDLCLSDVSIMAIASTEINLKQNNLKGKCIASDGFSKIEEKFDLIVSNPPFHQGIKTDYTATENFLRKCYKKINPKGCLIIVANDFLRYPALMKETFGNYKVLKKESGFAVYKSQKR